MSRKGDLLYFGHMFDTARKIQGKTVAWSVNDSIKTKISGLRSST